MTDTDRGFLHEVRINATPKAHVVVIDRIEEEDGNPADDYFEVFVQTADTIPGFEPVEGAWYFETDHDLPAWLYAWADPIIDASKDTDTYRAHAAEWIGPDGDWA